MKKIVAILSVASLFSVVCVSAERASAESVAPSTVVIGGGVVPQVCKVDSVNNGTLTLTNSSLLSTDTNGEIIVTCNTPTSKLDISVNSGSSVVRNGVGAVGFDGGTGGLSGATGTSKTATSTLNANKAFVKATITAPAGTVLQSSAGGPNYNVTVDTTLTP